MRDTRHKTGFTIVELLLALAIGAMLLVAVAVAFNASAMNYQENEAIFKTVNNARQALLRMTSQLRTADSVDLAAPGNQCNFFTGDATPEQLTYEFRDADDDTYPKTLLLITSGNAYVLCDNVTAATFTKAPTSDGNCKSVQISMTVEHGDLQRTVSAAAVIRRNLN
jgi:prepilin-type N-terminal cleavage/methylation domain-containing protein